MKTNNYLNVFKFEMLKRKKSLLIWGAGLMAVMALYMLIFPMVRDMAETMMANMSEELLQIFGMESLADMGNYNAYFASEFQIILVVLCGYTAFTSANIFQAEQNLGSCEFLYAVKYNRNQIFINKSLTVLVSSLALLLSTMIVAILAGFIVASDQINFGAILFTYLILTLPIIFSFAVGLFFASISKKGSNAGAIALTIVIVSYIIGYIALLGPKSLEFLIWLSPLLLLSPSEALNHITSSSDLTILRILYVLVISAILYVLAFMQHKKKDL